MKHFDQSSITFAQLTFKITYRIPFVGLSLYLLVSLLICSVHAEAQKPLFHIRSGDEAVLRSRWDLAFAHYYEAYQMDSSDFEVAVKLADAARQVKEYNLAYMLYAQTYGKDNGKLNPDGLYYLASLQKMFGEYEDAQRNFKKFLKKYKSSGSKNLVNRAEQEVRSALWALNQKDDLSPPAIERLSNKINSAQSESGIFISDRVFYSTTAPDGRWRIMSANASLDEPGVELQIESIDDKDEVANFFDHDGRVLFSLKRDGKTEVYTAQLRGQKLTALQNFSDLNNGGIINTMPTVGTLNGQRMLFWVSDRAGGEGGLDIWMAEWHEDGTVRQMVNAGKTINTPGDEISPLLVNNELLFSSDWHEGFGGQDIFKSTYNASKWEKPYNLGRPINSSWNDLGYTFNPDKTKAYLASNRPLEVANSAQQTCCNDLFVVNLHATDHELLQSKQPASLAELQRVLPVVLYFHNDEPNPRTTDTTTTVIYSDAYEAYIKLMPTYLSENTKGLSGAKKEEVEALATDFFELNVKKGMSDLELFSDLLLKELQAGKGVKIIVRGFASPRANSDYNLHLTKRRTASLVNYLSTAKDGAFIPYLNRKAPNQAVLEVQQLPFGEYKAARGVSDDLKDLKGSIYSRSASLERKIEIESVSLIPKQARNYIKLSETEHDFGKIGKYQKVYHTFLLENIGNETLVIDSAVASCGCTEPRLPKLLIAPGEVVPMEVGFDPFGKKGKDTKSVMLYIQGEEPQKIWIKAEVE